MNLDFYNGLTDHERAVIEAACYEENAAQPEEAMANNGTYQLNWLTSTVSSCAPSTTTSGTRSVRQRKSV